MPNGFHGDHSDWQSITDELNALRVPLDEFAAAYDLDVEWHGRNWPCWTARRDGPVRLLIEIYLNGEKNDRWNFGITAWQDREDGRYTKGSRLKVAVPLVDIESELAPLLHEAWRTVSSWTESDLRRATGVA